MVAERGIQYPPPVACFFTARFSTHSAEGLHFPFLLFQLPFTCWYIYTYFFLDFDIWLHFIRHSFRAFPTCKSPCLNSVLLFLPGYLSLFLPFIYFFFCVWILRKLVPTCRPADIFPVFLLVGIDCSEHAGCESWTSTISLGAFSQPRLYVMKLFQDEPRSSSQFLLSWSQGCNFLFALLPPLRVLNSTISSWEW